VCVEVHAKGLTDTDFVLVAEIRIENEMALTNITTHPTLVKVVGRNSRGTGPEIAVAEQVQG
jgi:hypothetical protein